MILEKEKKNIEIDFEMGKRIRYYYYACFYLHVLLKLEIFMFAHLLAQLSWFYCMGALHVPERRPRRVVRAPDLNHNSV